MKDKGNIYAINESNKHDYNFKINNYIDNLINDNYSARWVASLVADVHRTLIKSGVVMYPGNKKNPNGKIRLLYEAYPMAYIIEKAEGMSSDGKQSLLTLDFPWEDIHKKVPIFYGSEYVITAISTTTFGTIFVDSSRYFWFVSFAVLQFVFVEFIFVFFTFYT